jgi:hypothetical protein
VVIAESVEALHGDGNNLTKETALDETGAVVSGRGDEPNRHDILTGSNADGTAALETCEDWTSSALGKNSRVPHCWDHLSWSHWQFFLARPGLRSSHCNWFTKPAHLFTKRILLKDLL